MTCSYGWICGCVFLFVNKDVYNHPESIARRYYWQWEKYHEIWLIRSLYTVAYIAFCVSKGMLFPEAGEDRTREPEKRAKVEKFNCCDWIGVVLFGFVLFIVSHQLHWMRLILFTSFSFFYHFLHRNCIHNKTVQIFYFLQTQSCIRA